MYADLGQTDVRPWLLGHGDRTLAYDGTLRQIVIRSNRTLTFFLIFFFLNIHTILTKGPSHKSKTTQSHTVGVSTQLCLVRSYSMYLKNVIATLKKFLEVKCNSRSKKNLHLKSGKGKTSFVLSMFLRRQVMTKN